MNHELERALKTQELVCVKIIDPLEEFLIGIIEACDEEGIILLNIDYRGIATAHIYLAMDKVEGLIDEPFFISRVKGIQECKKNVWEPVTFFQNENIKEELLRWVYHEHKRIKFTFWDEQIEGFICELEEAYIVVEKFDEYMTEKREGYSVFSKKKLRDIFIQEDRENEKRSFL